MKDPYEKAWDAIGKALAAHGKMICWIAERTLSAKDFKEFINEFMKPSDDDEDLLEFIRQKGR